jgi:hypothetical protein
VVRLVALAIGGLVLTGASGCGRSRWTPEEGNGGDTGRSGSTGLERGGAGGGGAAGKGDLSSSGSAGTTSVGGSAGAGGLGAAGSGGFAGAVVPLTDAEVCADACAQTEFSFPDALCEDWRFPDYEQVPEYCRKTESVGCAARCEDHLGAVSPECNAALHRAIPCVARLDLYQGGPIAGSCIFEGCTQRLLGVSAECHGLRRQLARARELWASAGSDDYSYQWSTGASVYEIIVSDGVASLIEGAPADVPTIPELFDWIERSLYDAPAIVTYDTVLGYPREASARPYPTCDGDIGYSFEVTDLILE